MVTKLAIVRKCFKTCKTQRLTSLESISFLRTSKGCFLVFLGKRKRWLLNRKDKYGTIKNELER